MTDFFVQISPDFANSYELLERLFQVLPVVKVVTGYKQRLLVASFFYELGFTQQAHKQSDGCKYKKENNTEQNTAIDISKYFR